MLSFELKKPDNGQVPDELEVFLDSEGLTALLNQLRLLQDGRTEDIHLMSESWGGSHLDGGTQNPRSSAIQHVKILFRRNLN